MKERARMTKDRPTGTTPLKPVDAAAAEAAIMNGDDNVKKKRLILDVSPDLHRAIKVACADRGTTMVEELTALLESKYR